MRSPRMSGMNSSRGEGMNVGPYPRWLVLSTALFGCLLGGQMHAVRRYGRGSRRRYLVAAGGCLAVQQAVVGWLALGRHQTKDLPSTAFGPADSLTLARGAVAAHLAGVAGCALRDRSPARRPGATGVIVAATCLDWIDGRTARRLGGNSEWGSMLDLEVDSWLTLWTGIAAVVAGGLPRAVTAAPSSRYLLMRRLMHGEDARHRHAWWVRGAGVLQMLLFVAALARSERLWLRRSVRWAALPIAGLSLGSLFVQAVDSGTLTEDESQGEQLEP